MATAGNFTYTPRVASGVVPATNDASLTAPTHVTTVFTAGTSGSKCEEIRCVGLGTTVAGRLNVFLYDGSTYHLIDQYLIPAITPSTTQAVWLYSKPYQDLEVPYVSGTAWTICVSVMESSNESLVNVTCTGGDF